MTRLDLRRVPQLNIRSVEGIMELWGRNYRIADSWEGDRCAFINGENRCKVKPWHTWDGCPLCKRHYKAIDKWSQRGDGTEGWIYFVRIPDGPTKIGMTTQRPESRIASIQGYHPYTLEVVTTVFVKNVVSVESELHAEFAAYRLRGEWFDLSDEQLTEISIRMGQSCAA